MARMKHLKAWNRKDTPDHIIQEIDEIMIKLLDAIKEPLNGVSYNIVLSAFNRLHAAMIVSLINNEKEELRNATEQEVKGLIGNIEDISKVNIFSDFLS